MSTKEAGARSCLGGRAARLRERVLRSPLGRLNRYLLAAIVVVLFLLHFVVEIAIAAGVLWLFTR